MYFDKSKLRTASELESNYDIIVKDYNNFNYTYQDRLGKFKIDTLFKKWRGLYEFSLQADKKNVFLGSTVKSRKKNFGHYELEVDNKVIWDGIILATKANILKKFNSFCNSLNAFISVLPFFLHNVFKMYLLLFIRPLHSVSLLHLLSSILNFKTFPK